MDFSSNHKLFKLAVKGSAEAQLQLGKNYSRKYAKMPYDKVDGALELETMSDSQRSLILSYEDWHLTNQVVSEVYSLTQNPNAIKEIFSVNEDGGEDGESFAATNDADDGRAEGDEKTLGFSLKNDGRSPGFGISWSLGDDDDDDDDDFDEDEDEHDEDDDDEYYEDEDDEDEDEYDEDDDDDDEYDEDEDEYDEDDDDEGDDDDDDYELAGIREHLAKLIEGQDITQNNALRSALNDCLHQFMKNLPFPLSLELNEEGEPSDSIFDMVKNVSEMRNSLQRFSMASKSEPKRVYASKKGSPSKFIPYEPVTPGEYLFFSVYWWRQAAGQGLAEAQFLLGAAYSDGFALPKDSSLAAFWWRKAAKRGHQLAKLFLDDLERPAEITQVPSK